MGLIGGTLFEVGLNQKGKPPMIVFPYLKTYPYPFVVSAKRNGPGAAPLARFDLLTDVGVADQSGDLSIVEDSRGNIQALWLSGRVPLRENERKQTVLGLFSDVIHDRGSC